IKVEQKGFSALERRGNVLTANERLAVGELAMKVGELSETVTTVAEGTHNWDFSLFKNIPLKSESRYLQLRWEVYNAFNHTQWSGIDTTARFDASGNQVNTRFGQVNGARPARVMQGSLRLTF